MPKKASRHALVATILERYGSTYAEEAGIRLRDSPSSLYQLLNLTLLLSARIPAANGVRTARALRKAKLTTPQRMAAASWQERVDVITHDYKRYDESASRMLGQTAEILIRRYKGDLRGLRTEAARDVAEERRLLQQFKGIGSTGADIFLREVQGVWDECYPYVDDRVAGAAGKLGLPRGAAALARLVDREDFPRLVAGLVRIEIAKAEDEIEAQATSQAAVAR